MQHLITIGLVGGGGFIGANLRYWIGGWIQDRSGIHFPWQTLWINLSGSFLLGLFFGLMAGTNWHPNWRLFIGIGMIGGYTTYSTFAWESLSLLSRGQYERATFYFLGNAFGTIIAAWMGLVLARALLGGRT